MSNRRLYFDANHKYFNSRPSYNGGSNPFKWVNKNLSLKASNGAIKSVPDSKNSSTKQIKTKQPSRNEAIDKNAITILEAKIQYIEKMEEKVLAYKTINEGRLKDTDKVAPTSEPSSSAIGKQSSTHKFRHSKTLPVTSAQKGIGDTSRSKISFKKPAGSGHFLCTRYTLKKYSRSPAKKPAGNAVLPKFSFVPTGQSKYRFDRRNPTQSKKATQTDRSRFRWRRKSVGSEKSHQKIVQPQLSSHGGKVLFSKFKMRTRHSPNKSLDSSRSNLNSRTTSRHFYRNAVVRAKYQLVNKKRPYCIKYIRTGVCPMRKTCQLVHDPATIRICRRFVHDQCTNSDCTLDHSRDLNRMPICAFFENGICSRGTECSYLHIKHRAGTPVCTDFMWSFCPRGAKCYKRHVYGSSSYVKKSPKRPTMVDSKKEKNEREEPVVAGTDDGESFLPFLDSDSELESEDEEEDDLAE